MARTLPIILLIAQAAGLAWPALAGAAANTLFASADDPRYFGDRERGWFWYQDPPLQEAPPEELSVVPPPATSPDADPQALLKAYQQKLDDAKAWAVMRPTDTNVRRYIEVQKEVYDRSALFADTWRRVVWSHPDLDYAAAHPTNSVGSFVDRERSRAAHVAAVTALADTEGLFFFYSASCAYCHAQAPILREFSRRFGLTILAVSLDGSTLPEFPDAVPDNGLAARLGVTVTPALFMVNPRNQEITPVGYGLLTEADLLQRIHALTETRRGQF